MPIDYSRYPDNWLDIRDAILDRANHCCEVCGVRNHATIVRKRGTPDYLYDNLAVPNSDCLYTYPDGSWIKLSELPSDYDYNKPVKIILTIHHIGIDFPNGRKGNPHYKMDCRPDNLQALCQRCHFIADKLMHRENRAITMAARKEKKANTLSDLPLFANSGD